MPVLPLVASSSVLSAVSRPERSPSRIMPRAARSFTLPPGLYHSALAKTRTGATWAATRSNASSGVLPIRSVTDRAWIGRGLWATASKGGESYGGVGRRATDDCTA